MYLLQRTIGKYQIHITQSHVQYKSVNQITMTSISVYFNLVSFLIIMLTMYYKPVIASTMNIILSHKARFSL